MFQALCVPKSTISCHKNFATCQKLHLKTHFILFTSFCCYFVYTLLKHIFIFSIFSHCVLYMYLIVSVCSVYIQSPQVSVYTLILCSMLTELFLFCADKPHNPMVNAGAIVCTSLIEVNAETLSRSFICVFMFSLCHFHCNLRDSVYGGCISELLIK